MDSNAEEKLQHFTSSILMDARQEADAIYQEIKKESDAVLASAEDDALALAFRHIKSEISRIEADNGRKLSHTLMSNKREQFLRREAMADEVIGDVRRKLQEYVRTPAYTEYLKGSLARVLRELDGDTVVYLRSEDEGLREALSLVPTKHKLSFAEGRFILGGLEASCPDKKLHADATFDTRMQDLRSHFSELFGLKLGE